MGRAWWRMAKADIRTGVRREPIMIDGWPTRGEVVLITKDNHQIPLRVADVYIIRDAGCAFVTGYVPGDDRPRTGLAYFGQFTVLANCPRCLGTWQSCTCSFT